MHTITRGSVLCRELHTTTTTTTTATLRLDWPWRCVPGPCEHLASRPGSRPGPLKQ
jgi:hypothetical protein